MKFIASYTVYQWSYLNVVLGIALNVFAIASPHCDGVRVGGHHALQDGCLPFALTDLPVRQSHFR